MFHFKHDACEVIGLAMASVIRPPKAIKVAEWAKQNLVVPDGPRSGELWNAHLTPYIIEPLNALGPDEPDNEIYVRKSAQTGFTTLLIAAIGHTIDRDPCRMMVIQPTDSALSEFNRDKLSPALEMSKALAKKVRAQTSRSSQGSTTYSKRFPGGSLTLGISTSPADLRSKTVKKVFLDEVDEYPDDLDGQGDPEEMIDARYISFLQSGDWKKLGISTPTIKGASRIDRKFEGGDQRHWHVPCPHCGSEFTFEFGDHFKFSKNHPHNAYYVAPCCGAVIENHQKNELVRKGRWIAKNPHAGAYKSYHFDALSSLLVPWDTIAKKFVEAGDDPAKLKTFSNLWLGLAYEVRGDAPDHIKLMLRRRADIQRGRIPPEGLILTAAADVQLRGIYVEVVAWSPNRQSWTVEALFLDGETEDHRFGAWAKLTEVYDRTFLDAFGGQRAVDAFGVDSGYRTNAVYNWVRQRPKAFALKGVDGWSRPAMGIKSLVDVSDGTRRIRHGAAVWPVGTWPLKSGFYADLHKEGLSAGALEDPSGYCHFGDWLDEVYFKQITAEYLADERFRGRPRRVWKVRNGFENHFLDCRVYNMALADYLGLNRMTDAEWALLRQQRGAGQLVEHDLVNTALATPNALPTPPTQPAQETSAPREGSDWLDGYTLTF